MINEIESDVRRKAHDNLDIIMDQAGVIGEKSKETMNHVIEKTNAVRKNVDDYISKNQEKSVLIATGVGLVAGALVATAVARRKHNSCA